MEKCSLGEISYLAVAVATVVVIVEVATVKVAVTGRAVLVQVRRASGNFLEHKDSAGGYPLSAEAATAGSPLQGVGEGQDTAARLVVARLPSTIKLDINCMLR